MSAKVVGATNARMELMPDAAAPKSLRLVMESGTGKVRYSCLMGLDEARNLADELRRGVRAIEAAAKGAK